MTIDSTDNISVAGAIDDSAGGPQWAVVRKTPGQTWEESWAARTFPVGAGTTKGRGLVADSSGNLFVTGDLNNWTDPDDGTIYSGNVGLLRLTPSAP